MQPVSARGKSRVIAAWTSSVWRDFFAGVTVPPVRRAGAPGLRGRRRKFCAGLALAVAVWASGAAVRAQATDAPAVMAEADAATFDPGAWRDISAAFAARPEAWAEFTERRYFPFKDAPAVLRGQVRVSRAGGLSLAYQPPDERIVIVDATGLALREKGRTRTPPADERAAAVNRALMHVLRFDLAALAPEFVLAGKPVGMTWELTLVPKDPKVAQAFRRITVSGTGAFVECIELRRSQRQWIEIEMSQARTVAAFTAEEREQYFR